MSSTSKSIVPKSPTIKESATSSTVNTNSTRSIASEDVNNGKTNTNRSVANSTPGTAKKKSGNTAKAPTTAEKITTAKPTKTTKKTVTKKIVKVKSANSSTSAPAAPGATEKTAQTGKALKTTKKAKSASSLSQAATATTAKPEGTIAPGKTKKTPSSGNKAKTAKATPNVTSGKVTTLKAAKVTPATGAKTSTAKAATTRTTTATSTEIKKGTTAAKTSASADTTGKIAKHALCATMAALASETTESTAMAELYERSSSSAVEDDMEAGKISKDFSTASKDAADNDLEYGEHLGGHRQYWRDIILGVNDGLVSTFLLVATVAGGGLSTTDCLLTALGGAIAGAVSMCAGEYVATKSQNEVMEGEIKLERHHVEKHTKAELGQVNDLLQIIGITDEHKYLQDQLQRHYAQNNEALLKLMIALELGFIEEEERSPAMAGFVSFFLFLVGSLPSVIPFVFTSAETTTCLIAAAALTSASLLVVGAIKTWATRGSWLSAAMENLAIAGFGGAFAYGVGVGFDQLLHGSS